MLQYNTFKVRKCEEDAEFRLGGLKLSVTYTEMVHLLPHSYRPSGS